MRKSFGFKALVLACATLIGGLGMSNAEAAYSLSSEVKTATPALLEATQIGVKVSETPELQNLPNKDAILVTSFGTTFKETREATIDATVNAIKAANPNTKVVLAFTSHIIIDRIKANEGLNIPTPEEALNELKADGYTRVAITSLNIIPGIEYDYGNAVFQGYKGQFKKMVYGTPLMYFMGQEDQADDVAETMAAVSSQFPKLAKKDAVLLMAHGTPHPSNAYYSVMQNRLNEAGLHNVLIYSVEGWPHLDTVIPLLKEKGIKNVTLMPLMMVAGDHANNDMAGDEEDSHKVILQEEGFKVSTYLHGLGENAQVRQLFVDRANKALAALQANK
ncbi:MAG TPA: sirohydrochlorin cobaltochelatase [Candidatus Avacidaminococcus intestinavium]|uniref:Sirohydrochlorin cobaltochelatase n=1 Tax=Candidatus Avacidaminococcus intestinavium TaxID=2840684 RepID=A0A9D1SKR4_9FIRM|nr:sirohydrochlorin cobaltochelatase [Candidatus Avacidaminococcus intestinavium]